MADQPRNPRELYDWDNPLPGYREVDPRLDDRTGVGPGSPGGYRAGDPNMDRYGYAENRSFDPPSAYHSEFARGKPAYRPRDITPAEYRQRRGQYRGANFGGPRDNDYRQALEESRHAARDYQGEPFNPYESWWGIGPSFGFGYDLRGEPEAGVESGPAPARDHRRHFWNKAADDVSSWFGDRGAHLRREMDRGEHAGRGPKGYKRSDARIQEDVSDHLTNDSWLDASDIEVRAKEGEITLDGKVASREDKRRAELWAESVPGVGHVQNNLRVDPAMTRHARAAPTPSGVGQPLGENYTLDKQARGKA